MLNHIIFILVVVMYLLTLTLEIAEADGNPNAEFQTILNNQDINEDTNHDLKLKVATKDSSPKSLLFSDRRQDSFFDSLSSNGKFLNHHLWSVMNNVKKFVNSVNQGTRMARQILPSPMIILRKSNKKKVRLLPLSSNKHNIKSVKAPSKAYLKNSKSKEEIHETSHTYSEEHIHVDEFGNEMSRTKTNKIISPEVVTKRSEILKFTKKDAIIDELEKREEEKVEAAIGLRKKSKIPKKEEIIFESGYESNGGWKPIQKPKPASSLHTNVMDLPIAKQVHHQKHVIDILFEQKQPETQIKKMEAKIKPTATNFEGNIKIDTSDGIPNYPEHFLKENKLIGSSSNSVPLRSVDSFIITTTPVTTIQSPPPTRAYNRHSNFQKTHHQTVAQFSSDSVEETTKRTLEKKKTNKNLVAQLLNRGRIKFDEKEIS